LRFYAVLSGCLLVFGAVAFHADAEAQRPEKRLSVLV
jgi:hypothetical protein